MGKTTVLANQDDMDATVKVVIGCWVAIIAFWTVSAFWVKRNKTRQPVTQRLVYLALTVVVALLLKGSARMIQWDRAVLPHTIVVGVLSDLLVLAGLFIAIWARATLGTNWSARVTLKEDHELIQRGPYSVVRHPIYSGLLLMILGTAVLAGKAGAFAAVAISFGSLWIKLRQEEELLSKNLPGYPQYMRRTKALVPLVL